MLAVLAVLLGLLGLVFHDAPPPDDSHLLAWPAEVPPELNGYQHFVALEAQIDPRPFEDIKKTGELAEAENPDLEEVKALLAQWGEVLATIRRCASAPCFQPPEGTWPSFYRLMCMARIASLHALVLSREGQEEDAFDLALEIVALGHKVQLGGEGGMSYLIGKCIKYVGQLRIHALLKTTTLGADALLCHASRLADVSDAKEAFVFCERREYTTCSRLIDAVSTGELSPDRMLGPGAWQSLCKVPVLSRLLLKRNRTKEKLAQVTRLRIENAERPYSGMNFEEAEQGWASVMVKPINAVGKRYLGYFTPMDHYLAYDRFLSAGTRLLLALHAFRARHGRLPESLEDLVPGFIDAIPLDPYDGRELRYCPSEGKFYSVGRDLVDAGGGPNPLNDDEPTFFIAPLDR